jgi:hypothetical protein
VESWRRRFAILFRFALDRAGAVPGSARRARRRHCSTRPGHGCRPPRPRFAPDHDGRPHGDPPDPVPAARGIGSRRARGWAMSRMAAPTALCAPIRRCPPAVGFGRYADVGWCALLLRRYCHGVRARLTAIAGEGGPVPERAPWLTTTSSNFRADRGSCGPAWSCATGFPFSWADRLSDVRLATPRPGHHQPRSPPAPPRKHGQTHPHLLTRAPGPVN